MKNKNCILLIFPIIFLFLCPISVAQGTSSLLWKISGNGLEKPSYLFGTHHLISVSFLDSVPGLRDAFAHTEQTVGELDMAHPLEMQQVLMREAMMPAGITYDSLLNDADKQLLDSILRLNLGSGLELFGKMKPAMLNDMIFIAQYQKKYTASITESGIDQYFQDEARKLNRPVIGLEEIKDQIDAMFNSESLERQAELLICQLKNPQIQDEALAELQKAYHEQNLEKIREIYENEMPEDPCPLTQVEKDVMNKDRNEKWLTKIPALIKEKSSFIAVGCAHLPGKDGLIEGLRRLGYRVDPVK